MNLSPKGPKLEKKFSRKKSQWNEFFQEKQNRTQHKSKGHRRRHKHKWRQSGARLKPESREASSEITDLKSFDSLMGVGHVGGFTGKKSLGSTDLTSVSEKEKKKTKDDQKGLFYSFRKYELREHKAKFFQIYSKS